MLEIDSSKMTAYANFSPFKLREVSVGSSYQNTDLLVQPMQDKLDIEAACRTNTVNPNLFLTQNSPKDLLSMSPAPELM